MSAHKKQNSKRRAQKQEGQNADSQITNDDEPMGDINSEENSGYYFDSYSNISIHEEMIKDRARTESYYRAVMENQEDFQDKVVLDVGAGTGILSIFCARAGAKKVYAIEASSIASYAEKIVHANGLQNVIQVVHGRVEEIDIPEKVDIIISEWMGYFLFYESMLDTVIYARDKWLKPEGLMFPSHARLYLTAISDQQYIEDKINWWENIGYGDINMSPLIPFAKECFFTEPAVESISPNCEISDSQMLIEVDCRTVSVKDLTVMPRDYRLRVKRSGLCHGFHSHFDVLFDSPSCRKRGGEPVVLSTAPINGYTHWHQSIFMIDPPIQLKLGQFIKGNVVVAKNKKNPRFVDCDMTYGLVDGDGRTITQQFNAHYCMK